MCVWYVSSVEVSVVLYCVCGMSPVWKCRRGDTTTSCSMHSLSQATSARPYRCVLLNYRNVITILLQYVVQPPVLKTNQSILHYTPCLI